jgi:hypothetical protein
MMRGAAFLALSVAGAAAAAAPPPHNISCGAVETGLDYAFGDLRMVQAKTAAACCDACKAEPRCV